MKMDSSFRSVFLCLSLLVSFALAGCGEGWETQTVTSFPYGDERTAGSAIAYVQFKLLPEKPLKIVPVQRDVSPEPIVEKPAEPKVFRQEDTTKKMDKLFKTAQQK